MDKRTKICIWVILLGLGNFLAYTVAYRFVEGEAINGEVRLSEDGAKEYYLKENHPHGYVSVSRGVFYYSAIHSISIWPTVGAVMLAMLTLAKERFVLSLRSSVVRGRTLLTILATIIALLTAWITIEFIHTFIEIVSEPKPIEQVLIQATQILCA